MFKMAAMADIKKLRSGNKRVKTSIMNQLICQDTTLCVISENRKHKQKSESKVNLDALRSIAEPVHALDYHLEILEAIDNDGVAKEAELREAVGLEPEEIADMSI